MWCGLAGLGKWRRALSASLGGAEVQGEGDFVVLYIFRRVTHFPPLHESDTKSDSLLASRNSSFRCFHEILCMR